MRIKISGEVTAARLAEALQLVIDQCSAVRPGCTLYGANLYLTPYDADGLPFDLLRQDGKSLSLTLRAKSGELVKPALTGDGERCRQVAHDELARRGEARDAEQREGLAFLAHMDRDWERKATRNDVLLKQLDHITAESIKTMPDLFVQRLNAIVRAIWAGIRPVESQGKNHGVPKPCPAYSIRSGHLCLSVATWKAPRRISNPVFISTFHRNAKLLSFWSNEAWTQVCRKIVWMMIVGPRASVSRRLTVEAASSRPISGFLGVLAGKTRKIASPDEIEQAAEAGWTGSRL